MTANRHAELMMEYAKDAAETRFPESRWESMQTPGEWREISPGSSPSWSPSCEYRRKLQLVEGWAVLEGNTIMTIFNYEECAKDFCSGRTTRRIVHMKGVK